MSGLRRVRSSVLFALALVGGALFGGSLASAAAPGGAVTYTRSASCSGLDFHAASSSDLWGEHGLLRTGQGAFRCNASLPNGAVVKALKFTLYDNHPSYQLWYCGLVRARLTVPGTAPDAYDFMADTTPGGTGGTPGLLRLVDNSIAFATINNTTHAYYVQCAIDSRSNELGIYGATVVYSITSTKG